MLLFASSLTDICMLGAIECSLYGCNLISVVKCIKGKRSFIFDKLQLSAICISVSDNPFTQSLAHTHTHVHTQRDTCRRLPLSHSPESEITASASSKIGEGGLGWMWLGGYGGDWKRKSEGGDEVVSF